MASGALFDAADFTWTSVGFLGTPEFVVFADGSLTEITWTAEMNVEVVGEEEITPVRLDECWRCTVTIPREDPLGLCDPCRIQLRDL